MPHHTVLTSEAAADLRTAFHDLAPLIADAYALTERERVITQLVAEGLQTLVARVFFAHDVPRLTTIG